MAVAQVKKRTRAARDAVVAVPGQSRIGDALAIVEEQGLLTGGRTHTVRGRMPSLLVEQAKRKTGIQSDSKLLEAALANIVAGDDYAEWLLAQKNTVSKDLDSEF